MKLKSLPFEFVVFAALGGVLLCGVNVAFVVTGPARVILLGVAAGCAEVAGYLLVKHAI